MFFLYHILLISLHKIKNMQTFLPYESFEKTAQVLDYKRLGCQRKECKQILNTLESNSNAWKNHPAVLMWKNYEPSLKEYANTIIKEWISRGYKNNMELYEITQPINYPWWLGNQNFHRAMRSRLISKDPSYYTTKFPDDTNYNNGQYFWPINETKSFKII